MNKHFLMFLIFISLMSCKQRTEGSQTLDDKTSPSTIPQDCRAGTDLIAAYNEQPPLTFGQKYFKFPSSTFVKLPTPPNLDTYGMKVIAIANQSIELKGDTWCYSPSKNWVYITNIEKVKSYCPNCLLYVYYKPADGYPETDTAKTVPLDGTWAGYTSYEPHHEYKIQMEINSAVITFKRYCSIYGTQITEGTASTEKFSITWDEIILNESIDTKTSNTYGCEFKMEKGEYRFRVETRGEVLKLFLPNNKILELKRK